MMAATSDKKWEAHLKAYAAGDTLYKAERFRDALQKFRRALTLAPGNSDTLWAIAGCHDELGRPRLAERFYRAALQGAVQKDRAALYYNLGNALFDQGRFKEAIRCYSRVSARSDTIRAARKNMTRAKKCVLTKRSTQTRANSARAG